MQYTKQNLSVFIKFVKYSFSTENINGSRNGKDSQREEGI